jgi:hypothetical protein
MRKNNYKRDRVDMIMILLFSIYQELEKQDTHITAHNVQINTIHCEICAICDDSDQDPFCICKVCPFASVSSETALIEIYIRKNLSEVGQRNSPHIRTAILVANLLIASSHESSARAPSSSSIKAMVLVRANPTNYI